MKAKKDSRLIVGYLRSAVKDDLSIKSQSNKSILKNQVDRLAQSCGSISQREIKRGWAVDRKLGNIVVNQTQTKDTTPHHHSKEEINHLAKAWCELLLKQIQEARCNSH